VEAQVSDQLALSEFTVLLPTHNRRNMEIGFERAILSIYTNSLLPKRTLVVIDGEVDQVFKNKILELQDLYGYDCIWLPNNIGITKALNEGLRSIDTKWTIRADSDDINMPERFKALINKLEEGYDVVGSWVTEIDENEVPLCTRRVPEDHDNIKNLCKYRNPMNHMSIAFRTDQVKSVGGYPEIYKREDYGLWAILINQGALFANIQVPLVLASAGDAQYGRRSGLRYIRGEFYLQAHLVKNYISVWSSAICIGAARSVAFAMPKIIHQMIYRYILRSRCTDNDNN